MLGVIEKLNSFARMFARRSQVAEQPGFLEAFFLGQPWARECACSFEIVFVASRYSLLRQIVQIVFSFSFTFE